jgi:beta-aspartyl-dipeptidase (metallo-type)
MFQLITNARVFAPEPLGILHILICANRIVYLGEKIPQLDDLLELNVVDADGAILCPGFIDGHAHITGGGGEAGPSTRVPALHLGEYTSAGVTSVVGLLGTDDLTRNTQTLVTQVMGLREEGLSAWCYTGGYHFPVTTLTGSVRSDIVNLEPVIGVGELAISDHRSSQPALEEVLRVASDAHVAGLMTGKAGIVHFHLGDGARGLELINRSLDVSEIPARVFNPTHINRNRPLFEEACQLSKRGCHVDISAFPHNDSDTDWSAEEAVEIYLEGGFDLTKLTISSDGGGCLANFDAQGEMLSMGVGRCMAMADTMKNLIDQGLAVETVVPMMTSNVAQLLRLHKKGRIAPGFDADLVLLDESNRVSSVMALGQWHVQERQQVRHGLFESS